MIVRTIVPALAAALLFTAAGRGAELAVLTNANWERLAPDGKEADCILGDYALRSDRLWVVVAQPLPGRHANMTVRQVGGCVIDLTLTDRPNDQLSAFYPGKRLFNYHKAEIVTGKGPRVVLAVHADARPAKDAKTPALPRVRLEYTLEDGQPFLLVRSVFTNPHQEEITVPLEDDLRVDDVEARSKSGPTALFWVHDRHFEQAYGLFADGHGLWTRSDLRTSVIQYLHPKTEEASVTLKPGASYELVRRLIPGRHLLGVKGEVARLHGQPVVRHGLHIVDGAYRPVRGAEITLKQDGVVYGSGRTDEWGWLRADLPPERFAMTCRAVGHGARDKDLDLSGHPKDAVVNAEYDLDTAPLVLGNVTDEKGGPIPCKVAFHGLGKTPSPYWGPPSARDAVVNVVYAVHGKFTVPIAPGEYEAVVTYGPEYDAVRVPLKVGKGERVPLRATLKRAFATPGWVSADFHTHSSPSGDNTADQRGRVQSLICAHIEFAPCTEHNRIDTFVPHLQALKAEKLLGTCSGIELTGSPLPLNHQNAFPLPMKPRTQDGGAPLTDADPVKQIRRLAEWGDPKAERLVQQNHPDIGWLFFDRNGDGKRAGGFKEGFAYMHVIEVHPIHEVLTMEPTRTAVDNKGKKITFNHTVFNWLQLLNQGFRIPGVVNTDAHNNYSDVGGLRNYVRCDAKVPGDIDPLEIVRHAKRGHLVMSNGPFLDVSCNGAIPGDDLKLPGGQPTLAVRVLCANWYDVDRVQVLVNGRPDPKLNFTRATHPKLFRAGAVRFEHKIALQLKEDTHVIVVATDEGKEFGEVMGPLWGRHRPTAVSNPIFLDVDGGGFRANGDTLGQPLPGKAGAKQGK
jgi:hypothetical protein